MADNGIAHRLPRVRRDTIVVVTWQGKQFIEASIYGEFAVHQNLILPLVEGDGCAIDDHHWAVTHVRIGYAITTQAPSRQAALRLLKRLFVLDWSGGTKTVTRRNGKRAARIVREWREAENG